MADTGSAMELFISIGLTEQKAKETLKNDELADKLKHAIKLVSS